MKTYKEKNAGISVKRLIQQFFIFYIPLLFLVGVILSFFYYSDAKIVKTAIKKHQESDVAIKVKSITSDVKSVVSDLNFISRQHGLIQLVDKDERLDKYDLECDFLKLAEEKENYDQIRIIDTDGMEIIRVNYNNGNPVIVPDEKLQSKKHRYYFKETFALNEGEVYISPLDLNVENNLIELPYKPVIRLGTPVFDSMGEKRGVVVLNYLAGKLIDNFVALCSKDDDVALLNSEGYWLYSLGENDRFGFMFADNKNLTFAKRYPEAWKVIVDSGSGQIDNNDGIFTFSKVYPFRGIERGRVGGASTEKGVDRYVWIVVSKIVPNKLNQQIAVIFKKYIDIYFVITIFLALVAWMCAKISLREKMATNSLCRSEENLDGIIKSIADGIIVTDHDNNVLFMNPAAENIFGVSSEHVIGIPVDVAIREAMLGQRVNDTLAKKQPGYQFDFTVDDPNGNKPKIMHAHTSVIHDRKGRERGIVTIINDVTQEREAVRVKTEFLSTAAHELRSPLTSIRGFSEILLTRDNLKPEKRKEFLQYVNEQSVSLCGIINDLLDISRIEYGSGFSFNKGVCDIKKCVLDVVSRFKNNDEIHTFILEIPEEKIELYVDNDKFVQLLNNLLSNAVKYSPEGGAISLSVSRNEQGGSFTIKDEGLGMTPDQLKNVFEKFYRAGSSSHNIEGTGLGMTIVKYIVEAHDGEITIESEPGKGTEIVVAIPYKPSEEAEQEG